VLQLGASLSCSTALTSTAHTAGVVTSCLQDSLESLKNRTQMGRPGQPCEVATCYVFLASEDASYISGQALHPNGGDVLNT